MNAQSPRFGDRIDEVAERAWAGQRVVVPLGEVCPPHTAQSGGEAWCLKAGRVDEQRRRQREITAANVYTVAVATQPRHLGQQRHDATAAFQICLQAQHEGMALDDAGGGREHPGVATHGRFQPLDVGLGEPLELADAIHPGLALIVAQHISLRRCRRHDDLAEAAVRHRVALAVFVQQRLAAHAQLRLQRTRRVVDAGVDDLRVAAADFGADGGGAVKHQHLAASAGQCAGSGEAHHPGADHHGVATFSHPTSRFAPFADDELKAAGGVAEILQLVAHETAKVPKVAAGGGVRGHDVEPLAGAHLAHAVAHHHQRLRAQEPRRVYAEVRLAHGGG